MNGKIQECDLCHWEFSIFELILDFCGKYFYCYECSKKSNISHE